MKLFISLVWQCGSVAVWQCGSVAVWQRGPAVKAQGWDAEGPGFEPSSQNCLHTQPAAKSAVQPSGSVDKYSAYL